MGVTELPEDETLDEMSDDVVFFDIDQGTSSGCSGFPPLPRLGGLKKRVKPLVGTLKRQCGKNEVNTRLRIYP